jgi:hypothetical protein
MRYLILCEGNNEEAILNILLDNNLLKINRNNLIGQRVYPLKTLKNPTIQTELLNYGSNVIIYRVGDTLKDELKIPKELKHIVNNNDIYKYCTKPELEILLIINEKLFEEYNKQKEKPKVFAKKHIKFNGRKYDQSTNFIIDYFNNPIKLVLAIKEYKRIKTNNKNENYLADLLK